ncbi:hypothetical protein HVA01_27960 [Halovibrio variabilis]|uniref:7TM-DISM receptor extracellular domain-containing protein n=1 Tax=Halovibrio variabilis TaxID=31910 RepID=A0A511URE5_9GAMM|nr:hypothetical protein HVA01_27960 [Halovibrio variabilis]
MGRRKTDYTQTVFLYYALFTLGFTVAILTFNGAGTLMFWSALGDNTSRLVAIGFTFASTMATFFDQSFLDTQTYAPRWHRVLSYFRIYCLLALIATLVLPNPTRPAAYGRHWFYGGAVNAGLRPLRLVEADTQRPALCRGVVAFPGRGWRVCVA